MVALFAFFGYFASQLHLEEDINKLMPSSKNEDGTTKLAFADLKIKDKTFLLFEATDSTDVSALTAVCDAFVDSLLAQDKDSVIGDLFYRLDEDLLPNGIDYLSEHLPAYIDTTAYAQFDTLLTREHFVRQMQQNHDDLLSEVGDLFPELIEMDPMGMRNVLAEQMKPLLSAGTYQTIDNHFFVPNSTVCIAFLTPRFSSTNTGQGSALFEQLNALISQFATTQPHVRITYHGTPASGYYNSTQIKHDLTTTITGALILVLLFLLFCFRRWDTIPLLLLPVAFGTLFGLSMMYWLKGEFSLLALGIGGVVLGVALSYVLHILTHHQYVGDGEQMLRDQVKPVLLGCVTTIGSFAGLIFINTALLQDFGLFAAFAILGTTLFSLIWLPQMLSSKTNPASFKWLDRINTYPFDQNKPLLVCVTLFIVVGVGAYLVGQSGLSGRHDGVFRAVATGKDLYGRQDQVFCQQRHDDGGGYRALCHPRPETRLAATTGTGEELHPYQSDICADARPAGAHSGLARFLDARETRQSTHINRTDSPTGRPQRRSLRHLLRDSVP